MNRTGDSARPRRANAISRQLDDELIVYDIETYRAHSLNHTCAAVWKSCDGETTVADMLANMGRVLPGVDKRLVVLALIELENAGLLVKETFSVNKKSSQSRRNALQKMGKVAAVALPVITSILVPTPSMALSCFPLGHSCTKNSDCCSGHCGLLGINLACV